MHVKYGLKDIDLTMSKVLELKKVSILMIEVHSRRSFNVKMSKGLE